MAKVYHQLLDQEEEARSQDLKLGRAAASLQESKDWVLISKYIKDNIIEPAKVEMAVGWEHDKQYKGMTQTQLWNEYCKKREAILGYTAFENILESLISAMKAINQEKEEKRAI